MAVEDGVIFDFYIEVFICSRISSNISIIPINSCYFPNFGLLCHDFVSDYEFQLG